MKLLDKVIYHFTQPRLRLLHSIYFNFKLLPLKYAVKLPIYIYGSIKFYWLCGNIEIKADKVFSGMIKLGRNNELFNGVDGSSFISMENNSKVVFEGPCAIGNNCKIRVANKGLLVFGAYTFFGSSVKFICTNSIKIGDYTRCAYESQIVDTNSHYVLNTANNKVGHRNGPIIIGKYNWIGNRTTINKGCVTKDYTIVCSGSLLNKNYEVVEGEYPMLGGSPAKLLKTGLRRIFNSKIEGEISEYFDKNTQSQTYELSQQFEDDLSSIHHWFHNVM